MRVFALLFLAALAVWGSGAHAQESSYQGLSLGLVGGYMDYVEPRMREYGPMAGVNVSFFKLNNTGDVAYNISGDFLGGQLKYDGGSMDIGGANAKRFTLPTNDWMIDARGTIGAFRQLNRSFSVTPFIGLGYRVLNDKMQGSGSYNRNISYIYIPLGVSASVFAGERFSVSASVDWEPAWGVVISRFSDVDSSNPDITSKNSGSGFRLQLALRYDLGPCSIHVTPFYQKWRMDESDKTLIQYLDNGVLKDGYLIEPANRNDFVGANLGVDF